MPWALAASFSFGVMSDTQWKSNLDGDNPGTSAVGIINQINQQFINHGVEFVIQVGDLVDSEGILAGRNDVSSTILDGRAVVQDVNTGWTEASGNQRSDVLSLWGMANTLGSDQTDPYVLSLSYDPTGLAAEELAAGKVYLMTRDAEGNWVNAVDLNHGGGKTFVLGAYDPSYGLGTYGVNPDDYTAWAVLNHGSDFAVAAVPEPETWAMLLAGLGLVGLMARQRAVSA